MDKVYQATAMNMGWCMECHRGKTTPKNVVAEISKINPHVNDPEYRHKPIASVQCSACHH